MYSDVFCGDLRLNDRIVKHLVIVLPGDCKEGPCLSFGARARPSVSAAKLGS